mmetsp:Transcript_2737/g.4557  ORF Transcript_2737/g.4557 Transcript_2737/m.4557 type:complete len:212 (+) Transcript_2737:63-698(+)
MSLRPSCLLWFSVLVAVSARDADNVSALDADDCSKECDTCSIFPWGCTSNCADEWDEARCLKAKNNQYWKECEQGEAQNKCRKTCGYCKACEPCPTKCSIMKDCKGLCRPNCGPDDPGYPWNCDWCYDATAPPCEPPQTFPGQPPVPAPPPPCAAGGGTPPSRRRSTPSPKGPSSRRRRRRRSSRRRSKTPSRRRSKTRRRRRSTRRRKSS